MLAAHQAGKIRATEVRSSDYIEANSIFSFVLAKPLLAGKRAYVPGKLDRPHSWTSVSDVATALVTAAMPYAALWAAGLFDATTKELRHTTYQWDRPFVIDSSVTEREFGLTPTPIDTALAAVPR